MSTRGAWGIKKGDKLIVQYNHFDSYPTGLGEQIVEDLNEWYKDAPEEWIKRLNEVLDEVEVINEEKTPETTGMPSAMYDISIRDIIDNQDKLEITKPPETNNKNEEKQMLYLCSNKMFLIYKMNPEKIELFNKYSNIEKQMCIIVGFVFLGLSIEIYYSNNYLRII